MTEEQIMQRQEREDIRYETAREIVRILHEAKKKYDGMGGDWDGDDLASEVIELVVEDE